MGKKKPRPRRSFTAEFKAEIVELCQRGDRSVGQVAKDFDLTETAVREWLKQAERDAGTGDGGLTSSEKDELAQLRRENRRLREDVEILKRATAFFASMPRSCCPAEFARFFAASQFDGLSSMCGSAGHPGRVGMWLDRSLPSCSIEACPPPRGPGHPSLLSTSGVPSAWS
ncbi:transposase [Kribbella pittospori]|nr:transposase [Kribbella pittospori]